MTSLHSRVIVMLNFTSVNIALENRLRKPRFPNLITHKCICIDLLNAMFTSSHCRDYTVCDLFTLFQTLADQTSIWKSRKHVYITVAIWQSTPLIFSMGKLNHHRPWKQGTERKWQLFEVMWNVKCRNENLKVNSMKYSVWTCVKLMHLCVCISYSIF